MKCPVLVIHVSHLYTSTCYNSSNRFRSFSWSIFSFGFQGTKDDVVDWSHGKRLWELCHQKYEPLWIEGGDHGNLETFPVYTRHLKKFLSAIKKLPAEKEAAAESGKSPAENKTPSDDLAISEVPSMISRRLEHSRKTEHVDKRRRSTGYREKARSSTDRKEKSRRSVDCFDRIDELEQTEKPRKSFDRLVLSTPCLAHYNCISGLDEVYNINFSGRIGEKIRSMGLCNVDCFKEPSHSTEPCRGH